MNSKNDSPAEQPEEDVLHRGVRQIVLSRETIPRAPRWARAFRQTLLRFVRDIADRDADAAPDTHTPEEARDDPT